MQNDVLDADIIRSQMSPATQQIFPDLIIFPTIDSTNTYLLNLPTLEQKSGYICLAEQQTAGRGRQGRPWISPAQQNIYLSVLWKTPTAKHISGLSLVVGMAIIRALQKLGLTNAQIKWPNDIWVNQQKLAGILLESSHSDYIVIGLGINVHMPPNTEIGQPWTSLSQLLPNPITRNVIISHILNSLAIELTEFNLHGLQSLYTDWPEVDALHNQTITIQQGNHSLHGKAQGINPEGALLLAVEGDIVPVYSGEVTKIIFAKGQLHYH